MLEIVNLFTTPVFVQDYNFDLKLIEKECISRSKKDIGVYKSNEGGWQSNPIITNDGFFSNLISSVEASASEFANRLRINTNLKVKAFWININKFKDYNTCHIHPNCILSGVYYIKAPKNSGVIEFKNPYSFGIQNNWNNKITSFNSFNSTVMQMNPFENRVLMFPSWVEHRVLPNLSNEKRISISFNLS